MGGASGAGAGADEIDEARGGVRWWRKAEGSVEEGDGSRLPYEIRWVVDSRTGGIGCRTSLLGGQEGGELLWVGGSGGKGGDETAQLPQARGLRQGSQQTD